MLSGKSEATDQAISIPQIELKQVKVSNYSSRDAPDSLNLLRCLKVNGQAILQARERPHAARGHRGLFGFPSSLSSLKLLA